MRDGRAALSIEVKPDYEAFLANIRRKGAARRVHHVELVWDGSILDAIAERFGVKEGLDSSHPDYARWYVIKILRFLGYDYVPVCLPPLTGLFTPGLPGIAAAPPSQTSGADWVAAIGSGGIRTWEAFEKLTWPDPFEADTSEIEWFHRNLPDDMCLMAGCHNVFEYTRSAMSYEGLCYAFYDQPELVDAFIQRMGEFLCDMCQVFLQFERIKFFFEGDDMGFKTGTMVSHIFLKEKVLPWHKRMAELCHQKDRVYCLHSCGKMDDLMGALIEEVKLDGRHSFEDTIEPVTLAKQRWGNRIALLGGIDMDFLCRSTPEEVRRRVRETLDICLPGGGYCLGTGNTVASYVPVGNYLAMLDEGRRYTA